MRATSVRTDILPETLRIRAKKEKDARICKRLLGIAHLLEKGNRTEAQKIACLTVNNFRTWIKRFNSFGIEGLISKKPPGRPEKLSNDHKEILKQKVLSGPSCEEGLVRYRLVDLQAFLKEDYQIEYGISGLWNKLKELDLSWKTGRQRHPQSNEAIQESFKKTLLKS